MVPFTCVLGKFGMMIQAKNQKRDFQKYFSFLSLARQRLLSATNDPHHLKEHALALRMVPNTPRISLRYYGYSRSKLTTLLPSNGDSPSWGGHGDLKSSLIPIKKHTKRKLMTLPNCLLHLFRQMVVCSSFSSKQLAKTLFF